MTTKTIMMAVAAAMGLAASASVIEVKFTVKTEIDGKVASKVISGLYDTDSEKHVFWSVEKQTNEKGKKVNVNVPYENTYFGLVNDTAVAKKVGQNAELVWGDDANPENVLVAGAWGTAAKKSGQVAGTLNGVPATGTWSAKANTKSTYAALLAKYGLTQVENRETGIVEGLNEKVAQTIKDANEKIAAAEAKAQADIEAAQAEGEAAVEAAKKQAEADVEAAKAAAAAEIAKAQEEFNAQLAAKNAELEQTAQALSNAVAEAEILVESFKDINDPDAANMFKNYLDTIVTDATNLKTQSQAVITTADEALAAYETALDLTALSNAVLSAKADLKTAKDDLAAKTAVETAITYTNAMANVIGLDGGASKIDAQFANQLAAAQAALNTASNDLTKAQTTDFVAYTNTLVQTTIPAKEEDVASMLGALNTAKEATTTANEAYEEAKKALADYVEPAHDDYDTWLAKQEGSFADEVAKKQAYEAYVKKTIAAVYDPLVQAETKTKAAYNEAVLAESQAQSTYDTANGELKALNEALKTAQETGKIPNLSEYEKKVTEAEAALNAVKAEIAFWKDYPITENGLKALAAEVEAATAAKDAAATEKQEAEKAVAAAEEAYNEQATTASTALSALSVAIGGETLTDQAEKALPLAEIKEKVAAFKAEPYERYITEADTQLKAVESIREKLYSKLVEETEATDAAAQE